MAQLAINVALLPPDEVMDICIVINKNDPEAFLNLNKHDCLPHITLVMAIIEEGDLPKIQDKIEKIAQEFVPLELELTDIYSKTLPNGKNFFSLKVRLTEELKRLHIKILKTVKEYNLKKVNPGMFFQDADSEIAPISIEWTENYIRKRDGHPENFSSHISLVCSQAEYQNFPVKFAISRLVVGQMGSYCTCRKIFYETSLKK